jgi:simple sugar transport system ATP-binding protein
MLEDVEQLCTRVAVLRRGKLVGEAEPPYRTGQLVTMMFGKPVTLGSRETASPGDPVIELRDVSIESYRLRIQDANLKACAGEVIGLAGMEGSGQRTFMRPAQA